MSRTGLAAAAVACLALAGCGDKPKYVSVSGGVKVDGKPYKGAVVAFQPYAAAGKADAAGVGSTGLTDENGKYTLTATDGNAGAIPGGHKVRIQTKRDNPTAYIDPNVGSDDNPDGDAPKKKGTGLVDPIPTSWYGSEGGKDFTVPATGTDTANFDIESEKPKKKK